MSTEVVETYRGYNICSTPAGYFLVVKEGEWDFEQIPFGNVHEAQTHIDEIHAGTAMTAEEADRAYDEAPAEPMTHEEIEAIVRKVTGK